jgi:glycosyltransferase involved in cell wall biosynthesis
MVVALLRKMFPAPSTPEQARSSETSSPSPDPLPYYPFHNLHPDFVKAVDEELDKGYDIFQAEFCEMLSLGPIVGDRAKKLFIHHQLHFIYAERFLNNLQKPSANAIYLTERIKLEEKAFLQKCDAVVTFSEIDAALLREFCPGLSVDVSPFPAPENPDKQNRDVLGEICEFVFIASEVHSPNTMGLRWFMEEVWGKIKSNLPNIRISVVGHWSKKAQSEIPNYSAIDFQGFVPSLQTALQHKIMIVPIWIGSGIRTKILAAWSCGTPVVSTTIGAEGLHGDAGKHFLIADDPNEFAQACLQLAVNVEKRNSLIRNGLENLQQHYSLDAVKDRRLEIYQKLVS